MHSRPLEPRPSSRLPAYLLAWLLLVPGVAALAGVAALGLPGAWGPLGVAAQGGEGAGNNTTRPAPSATAASIVDYGDWPTLHGDSGHSGAAGFGEPGAMGLPLAQVVWEAQIATDPVSAHGLVVGGRYNDKPSELVAVSLQTGQEVWSTPLEGLTWSAAAFDGRGRVFVETLDPEGVGEGRYSGTLQAFDSSNGQLLWRSNLTTTGGTSVVANGTLFTFTEMSLEALSPATGEGLWSFPLNPVLPGSSPAVSQGLAVVVDGFKLRALEAANGSQRWAVNLSLPGQLVTLGQGLAVVRTDGGTNLTAYELADGSVRWRFAQIGGGFPGSFPALGPEALYTYFIDPAGALSLLALSLEEGFPLGGISLDSGQSSSLVAPLVTPLGFVSYEPDGAVRVRNLTSGNLTATYITQAPLADRQLTITMALLALTGDRLLVTTSEGLLAFGTPVEPPAVAPPEGEAQAGSFERFTTYITGEGVWAIALLAGLAIGATLSRKRIMGLRQKVSNLQAWLSDLHEDSANAAATGPTPEAVEAPAPTGPMAPATNLPDHVPRAVVVCGAGPLTPSEQAALPGSFVIAADGGANALHRIGRAPDLLIGDFDSIQPEVLDWCRKLGVAEEQHPMAKDATDGELAVEAALSRGANEVVMVGALGGRTDHSYANMGLLELIADKGAFGTIVGPDIDLFAVTPDQPLLQPTVPGRTVSLIPLSERVLGIQAQGLRWPLSGAAMMRTHTLGVSNKTTSELIEVRVSGGTLLVGINRPAHAVGA